MSREEKNRNEEYIYYIVNLYVEEYKIIKEESMLCMKNQTVYATVALTLVGFWIKLVEAQYKIDNLQTHKLLLTMIYTVFIPLVSLIIFSLFFREIIKIMVNARYLRKLEKLIHVFLGENYFDIHQLPFDWENYYLENKKHSFITAFAILVLYVLISISSITYSFVFVSSDKVNFIMAAIVAVIVFICGIHFTSIVSKEMHAINRKMPLGHVDNK